MLDLLITSGQYPDFEQNKLTEANIGVQGGKIAYIGPDKPEASNVIDAKGLVVSPGFIDIHMHEENFSEGLKWQIARMMAGQGVTLAVGGNCGEIKQPLKDFKKAFNELGGCPVNYIILSGYNYYRRNVLGLGNYDAADQETRDKIKAYMLDDLKEGAWGISFGIEYDPGITLEEMQEAVNVSDNEHLLIAAHYRNDSTRSIPAIKEMIELQNSMNKKFQISHLSSCSAFGQMDEALEIINDYIARNPLLNYDTYPYNAFSTHIGSTVFEDGCFEPWDKTYKDILLTEAPYQGVYCTKEILEDARKNYPEMLAVAFVMNESEIVDAITNPSGMVASDGIISNGLGHPRAAGTFPRVLGKYVREEGKLPLVDALRKMTLEPAKRLEIENTKGVIKVGADADLTVFNPDTITDGPTFMDITIPNKGIEYVFVGGEMTVIDNQVVNEKPGKFLNFHDFF